ncbi:MAG TPA: hypothetical protein PLM29_14070 [Deltaproteobacteria bacterium]|nr:hypothetical protein [Deltaproteobacteria bacterium]
MFRKIVSTLITAVFAFFTTSAIAQAGTEQTQVKKWDKHTKAVKKVKSTRTMTPDGKQVLVDETGTRYLLSDDGKRFMVDQNGNKIQLDDMGKYLLMPEQREINLRLGPGPVA